MFSHEELQHIQDELNIEIPQSYWEIMTNFPYPEFAEANIVVTYLKSSYVLEDTQAHRKRGWFDIDWPNHYLVIGETGCGDTYFMLAGESGPVFLADHEAGPHPVEELEKCKVANTIEEHIKETIDLEIECQEAQRRRAERKKNKKWWQFWI